MRPNGFLVVFSLLGISSSLVGISAVLEGISGAFEGFLGSVLSPLHHHLGNLDNGDCVSLGLVGNHPPAAGSALFLATLRL